MIRAVPEQTCHLFLMPLSERSFLEQKTKLGKTRGSSKKSHQNKRKLATMMGEGHRHLCHPSHNCSWFC